MSIKPSLKSIACAALLFANATTIASCGHDDAQQRKKTGAQGVVTVKAEKAEKVPAQAPVQTPTQAPERAPDPSQIQAGGKAIEATTEYVELGTSQSPVQVPCAKGEICFKGDGVEYPSLDGKGDELDRETLETCVAEFRGRGKIYDGSLPVVQASANVGFLSGAHFEDYSRGRKLVLVDNVNILSGASFELGNPEALYCVRNFNFLGGVSVKGCDAANIVMHANVQILAGTSVEDLACK